MGGVIGVILLDETVVGVALPTISRDLGLSTVAGHWVINAYLLVLAGLAAAGGKLGDLVGLKALFLVGISIFALASLASGFAQSGGRRPALRGVMNAVPVDKQGQAGGIAMTSQLLGGTVGMTACGTLLAATGDYRAVFLVTGALSLVVLVIAWFTFERRRGG